MDREVVLVVLVMALAGPTTFMCGWWRGRTSPLSSGKDLEQRAWQQLWAPLIPAALIVAGLVGWALLEPDEAESIPWILFVVATPFAVIVVRATLRAVTATAHDPGGVPAATVGLLRPRLLVSRDLADSLDGNSLEAACAHERAHARHYDPLRIWLAQFATDLQWPWSGAFERLGKWRLALEIARDEEARGLGVQGEDLAEAVIVAARLSSSRSNQRLVGMLTGNNAAGLKDRVQRLLAPLPTPQLPTSRVRILLISLGVAVAIVLGAKLGEATVGAILTIAS